jgi:hypothetical protein
MSFSRPVCEEKRLLQHLSCSQLSRQTAGCIHASAARGQAGTDSSDREMWVTAQASQHAVPNVVQSVRHNPCIWQSLSSMKAGLSGQRLSLPSHPLQMHVAGSTPSL